MIGFCFTLSAHFSNICGQSLNATIPEEKDPSELTMEEALILIEKRKEYDRNKKRGKK